MRHPGRGHPGRSAPDMESRLSRVTFQGCPRLRGSPARRARSAPNGVAQRAERAGVPEFRGHHTEFLNGIIDLTRPVRVRYQNGVPQDTGTP